ncbi:MAG: nucleotide exchange factor GrpE [Brumimicrobium sp.]
MGRKDRKKDMNEELNDNENLDLAHEEGSQEEETAHEESSPLDEMQQKHEELNNKYLRLYSEFDNFRRRTSKEKIELISSANAEIIGELLTILDDFERAIKHNASVEDSDSIKHGFELIYNKLFKILTDKGLKPMDSEGKDFDVENHEAIANVPGDPEMKGKIIDVTVKGYFLNDKVLRHAQVVVGQ